MSSFTLSLQHTAKKSDQSETLPELVKRIHEQRGHFRNVSEQGLLEEIQAAEDGGNDQDSISEDEQDGIKVSTGSIEEVYKIKEELRKYIAQAQNDALTALDFVSLLLSKDKPLQGASSMSPLLKQMVPAGSLGYVKFPPAKLEALDSQKAENTVIGWNFDSLTSTADRILQSAERLEREIEKETNYWHRILSINNRGWSLCRLPGESHTIGVRFGFAEAAPAFQTRDLAALRPDSNGDVVVDLGWTNDPKAVRVRLQQGTKILGTSTVPHVALDERYSAEDHIQKATDSQFEEELFFEMTKEARILLPYGVKVKDDLIIIPWQGTSSEPLKTVLVDIVPLEESSDEDDVSSNNIADTLALALRILLTHAYRHRFHRRTKPPPPLTGEKPAVPPVSIIRPVMNHFQHHSAVQNLSSLMQKLRNESVGSKDITPIQIIHHYLPTTSSGPVSPTTSHIELLLSALTNPLSTTLTTQVPLHRQTNPKATPLQHQPSTQNQTLSITATTSLASPFFGTRFTTTLAPLSDPTSSPTPTPTTPGPQPSSTTYTDLQDLTDSLSEILGTSAATQKTGLRHRNARRRGLEASVSVAPGGGVGSVASGDEMELEMKREMDMDMDMGMGVEVEAETERQAKLEDGASEADAGADKGGGDGDGDGGGGGDADEDMGLF